MNVPKLRFKEFNDEYNLYKMSDISKINQGLQIEIKERFTEKGPNRYFYITNQFLKNDSKEIYYIENPSESVICNEDDILMTRTGNTGKVLTNISGCFHNNFFKIKYDKSIVNKNYLYYILTSPKIQKTILNYAGTSTIPDLNHSDFYRIKVFFPSIKEQEKISKTLELLDKKIELQSKKIEDLKLFKKGLSNDLINGINEYKEVSLKDIGITYSGLSGKSKEDFESGNSKFVSFMSILKDKIEIDKLPTVMINGNEKQNKVQKYDLFFNTSSETKEEVALCSTINEDVDNLYLNSFCFGYRINDLKLVNNEYLNIMLHCTSYRKLISNLGQGFTRVNISKNELMDLVVKVPSIDDQIKIVDIISKVKSIIDLEAKKLSKLQELKKGLMQNMFV